MDGVKDVFRALLRHAFLRFQVFERKSVKVWNALDFTGGKETCDKRWPEIFDVHRFAANEMLEQTLHLCLTVHVFATENHFAVDVCELLTAHRAFFGCHDGGGSGGTQLALDIGDFRDDLATLLYADCVAVVQVKPCHFVEVVEGGALHGCTCEAHGCEIGYRRHGTGATDLEFYRQKRRVSAFRLEFVCDGPARALARAAEFSLLLQIVQLHDHAVNIEREAVAARTNLLRNRHDFIDRIGSPVIVRMETETFELLQVFFVSLVVALRNVVCKKAHRARLAFGNALELERARNRIAAVLEGLLVFQDELLVQTFKCFAFHVDFTADFECSLRNIARVNLQFFRVKIFRNVCNRERIQRHVIALGAIATRCRLLQAAILVNNRKADPVDFSLANPRRALV